VEDETVDGNLV